MNIELYEAYVKTIKPMEKCESGRASTCYNDISGSFIFKNLLAIIEVVRQNIELHRLTDFKTNYH